MNRLVYSILAFLKLIITYLYVSGMSSLCYVTIYLKFMTFVDRTGCVTLSEGIASVIVFMQVVDDEQGF